MNAYRRREAAWRGAVAALVAFVLAGCGGTEAGPAGGGANDEPGEGGGPVARGAMTDAQVAALVQLINGTEASAARAIEPKLVVPGVKAYAATLLADHTALMAAMPALDGPRNAPPQTATLRAIFHSQAAMLATLPAGPAFDALFVSTQVADHAMAIDSLLRWREVAGNEELRRAIRAAIPVMQSHLERARALYGQLNRTPAALPVRQPTRAPPPPPGRVPGPDTLPPDTARGDTT